MNSLIIYALILLTVLLLFIFRSSLASIHARVELQMHILVAIMKNMCTISDFFSPEAYRKKSRDWAIGYLNYFIVTPKSRAFIEHHKNEYHMHTTRLWRIGAVTYLYDYSSGLVFMLSDAGTKTPSTPEFAISEFYIHTPHSDVYSKVMNALVFSLYGIHYHDKSYNEFHDLSDA